MDMDIMFGKIRVSMKAITIRTCSMVLGSTLGSMVDSTKVNGKTVRWTGRAS